LIQALVLLIALITTAPAQAEPGTATPDPHDILIHSDRARGGGLPGIEWEIQLQAREHGRDLEPQRLLVQANSEASVAQTLEPVRFKGSRLLQIGRNMWLTKPGLSKPIPISPRQRLSGQAANGDIAATDYAGDYDAVLVGQEEVNGTPCWILDLTAKGVNTTYAKIRYWVDRTRLVGVKAEFFALGGKPLKSAVFEYHNAIAFEGEHIPFVSRMTITDALSDDVTVMAYGAVTVKEIPPSIFDLGRMR